MMIDDYHNSEMSLVFIKTVLVQSICVVCQSNLQEQMKVVFNMALKMQSIHSKLSTKKNN